MRTDHLVGDMRMMDMMPGAYGNGSPNSSTSGVSAGRASLKKAILSAVFTTALNDQVTFCTRVRA